MLPAEQRFCPAGEQGGGGGSKNTRCAFPGQETPRSCGGEPMKGAGDVQQEVGASSHATCPSGGRPRAPRGSGIHSGRSSPPVPASFPSYTGKLGEHEGVFWDAVTCHPQTSQDRLLVRLEPLLPPLPDQPAGERHWRSSERKCRILSPLNWQLCSHNGFQVVQQKCGTESLRD